MSERSPTFRPVRPLPRRAMPLLLAVLACACAADVDRRLVETRDSAGIRIVTNLDGSVNSAEAWSLEAEPVVEIGAGASPEVPLHRVVAVAPLPGGGVAVGAESPPQVVVFGPDGRQQATLGRPGKGPGEFTRVGSLVPLGEDSLAVWDPDRRRISVFMLGGSLEREVDLSDLAPLSPTAAPSTEAPAAFTHLLPLDEQTLVLFAVGAFGPGTGARRPEAVSHRITMEGESVSTLGPFPGYPSYQSAQTGMVPYPFGAETHGATSSERLVVGTAESAELRLYGPDGRLRGIIRWPEPDRTVAGPRVERWDSALEAWLAERPEGEARVLGDLFARVPRPDRLPAYGGLLVAEGGGVWVSDYPGQLSLPMMPIDLRVPERRWLVFDGNGTLTATVRTPPAFEPHAVQHGRVWGVFRDELGTESVRAYRIGRQT